jgi:hypothetical protein
MPIFKHVFQVVVFNEDENYDPEDLVQVSYDITDGEAIGDFKRQSSNLVPANQVKVELVDIGNDGTFFDMSELEEEDES